MKKLLILLFSILISFNSYGEWIKIGDTDAGDTAYIDYSKIKKHNGFIFVWELLDKVQPTKWGDLSVEFYIQTECATLKSKYLTYNFYKQPMGIGDAETITPDDPKWFYPSPNSAVELVLESACDFAN